MIWGPKIQIIIKLYPAQIYSHELLLIYSFFHHTEYIEFRHSCVCVWKTLCTNLPPVNIACVSIYSHIFTKIHFYYIFLYFVCWDDLTRFSPSLHSISKCIKKLSHFLLILRQHIWYTEICFNEFTNLDMNLRCHMLDSVDVIKIIWNAVARRTNQRNFKNYSNCERYSV